MCTICRSHFLLCGLHKKIGIRKLQKKSVRVMLDIRRCPVYSAHRDSCAIALMCYAVLSWASCAFACVCWGGNGTFCPCVMGRKTGACVPPGEAFAASVGATAPTTQHRFLGLPPLPLCCPYRSGALMTTRWPAPGFGWEGSRIALPSIEGTQVRRSGLQDGMCMECPAHSMGRLVRESMTNKGRPKS